MSVLLDFLATLGAALLILAAFFAVAVLLVWGLEHDDKGNHRRR